jgi:hypothetical protein
MPHFANNLLIKFILYVLCRRTMLRDSVLNASPIKEKKSPNTLRYDSAHMLHLASNVLKNVLLMYFHDDTMRRDSISLPHQEFLMNFLFSSFLKLIAI